jgi:hypothetical protein
MTTKVTVFVNGRYRATVKQDDLEPVTVEGNYDGGTGTKDFWLKHPANSTFIVTEQHVPEDDVHKTADGGLSAQTDENNAKASGLK